MTLTLIQAVKPMTTLIATAVETGTGTWAGMGATKALHSTLGASLACFSYLQGLGVQSNEKKEKIDAGRVKKNDEDVSIDDREGDENADGVGSQIIARAYKIGTQDILDIGKSLVTVAAGAAPMLMADYMGGVYMQEQIAKSFGFQASSNPVQVIPGMVVCTVADAVIGMAMIKSIQAVGSVILATQSYLQSQGIRSNEEKEGVSKDKQVSGKLENRATSTISQDISDSFKAVGVLAMGTFALYLGSALGGVSVQQSMLNSYRAWRGV